jgi:hypothetical protein
VLERVCWRGCVGEGVLERVCWRGCVGEGVVVGVVVYGGTCCYVYIRISEVLNFWSIVTLIVLVVGVVIFNCLCDSISYATYYYYSTPLPVHIKQETQNTNEI